MGCRAQLFLPLCTHLKLVRRYFDAEGGVAVVGVVHAGNVEGARVAGVGAPRNSGRDAPGQVVCLAAADGHVDHLWQGCSESGCVCGGGHVWLEGLGRA